MDEQMPSLVPQTQSGAAAPTRQNLPAVSCKLSF